MSMADIVSATRLHVLAEAALVVTLAAFATVLVTVFLGRNRAAFDRARFLPLEDEQGPGPAHPGGAAAGGETGHE
jgi:cbb3-type cytochrome oxidase subunit 3